MLASTEDASLIPVGDLDWMSAFSLRHAVHDLMEPGIEILIDLSRVESVDGTGISALVWVRAAGERGGGHRPHL